MTREYRAVDTPRDYLSRELKAGDIIAFSGFSWLSASINMLTYGVPRFSISHVGIVGKYQGKLYLFEALAHPATDCALLKRKVVGAQAHTIDEIPLNEGKVWHYPLHRALFHHEMRRMTWKLLDELGTPYDVVGALRAGGFLTSIISSRLHRENRASLFCSEWAASTLNDIGIFPTGNFSRWSPNRLCRIGRRMGIFERPVRVA